MKRGKANRKTMQAFTSAFGFREPFHVLADAEFVSKAATQKMEVHERLTDVLGGKIRPMITQCSMEELYQKGTSGQAAVNLARSDAFERKKCNHWQKLSSEKCLQGVVGADNKARYVVATQSSGLREHFRSVPGVPLVYINPTSVVILEPLSEASVSSKSKMDHAKTHVSAAEASELNLGAPVASTSHTAPANAAPPAESTGAVSSRRPNASLTAEALLAKNSRSKGGKQKGANPLSMKKKKGTPGTKVKGDQGKSDGKQGKERKVRKKVKDRQQQQQKQEGQTKTS